MLLPGGTIYARTPKHYSVVSVHIGCLPWDSRLAVSWLPTEQGKYITLTHVCQPSILAAWKRNRNTPQCGSPRKICKRSRVFGSCTGASLIWRRFDWPCKLWHGKSSLHPPPLPQGLASIPLAKTRGLTLGLINRGPTAAQVAGLSRAWVSIRVHYTTLAAHMVPRLLETFYHEPGV